MNAFALDSRSDAVPYHRITSVGATKRDRRDRLTQETIESSSVLRYLQHPAPDT
jgi:hypothetical protein